MAFGLNKTKQSPIAIDFGADCLKVLQIVPTDPPQLVAVAGAVIPEHARTDANARLAFLAEALRNLLKTQPFRGRRAMLSIPAFQTMIQHLEIATGEHETLDAQVGLQLQQRLNVDPSRMVIRHFPVAQVIRDGQNRQEVICIAARKDAVLRYIDLAHKCKLDVVGMHSEPHCILSAFSHVHRRAGDEERALCFVDIGSATTKVVISHGREMVFAKSIHAAGDQFTRQYAARNEMSFLDARSERIAQAEGVVRAQPEVPQEQRAAAGLSALEAEPGVLGSRGVEAQRSVAIAEPPPTPTRIGPSRHESDDTLECLVDELQLCMRHHQSLFEGKPVEKLVFLGGEARHTPTCQAIARSVRTAAQLGDPFARLMRVGKTKKPSSVDLEQPQPGWAVPMGLCYSEANL